MMSSRSSPRERLASSGSVLSDDSEMPDHLDGLDDVDFQVSDPRLLEAVDKAGKEKNIMPLIKEELRLSILSRRNKEGKGEIVIEEKKPQVKRALTPQEKERKLRRQEQNRRAARKCRKKKKDCEQTIMKAYNSEVKKNQNLALEVEELRKEKEKLEEILRDHKCFLQQEQHTFVPIPDTPHLPPYDPRISDTPHLPPYDPRISPFDTGMSSATEPDTPNPTTPHTPGQTFSFSPLPFSSYTEQEEREIYSREKDECPSHTDILSYAQPNLDDCFGGSEIENIDLTPFASFESTQDCSQYVETAPPAANSNVTSAESSVTMSGLEAVLDLLNGQADVYPVEENTEVASTIEFSQACETISYTNFHDTI